MKKLKALMEILLFTASITLGLSAEKIQVLVEVCQVLPVQGVVFAGPDKKGGIIGTMCGASAEITDSFPSGIVLLDSGAASDLPLEVISKEVKNRIAWPFAKFLKNGPRVDFIGEQDFLLSTDKSINKKVRYEFNNKWGRYLLEIKREGVYQHGVILAVRFSATMKAKESQKPTEVLLDKVLGFDYSRILLIGFPDKGEGPSEGEGRIIYWVAILARNA